MNKSAILKIAGILIVPFIIMLVGVFFLYPKLNADKYNEIVSNFEQQQEENFENELQNGRNPGQVSQKEMGEGSISDSIAIGENVAVDSSLYGMEMADSLQTTTAEAEPIIQRFEQNEIRLHGIIDSLYAHIEELEIIVDSLQNPVEEKPTLDPKEFAERVKSLLNLEEGELSPILAKMSKEQIVRLYNGGGTIQRQKILRSLDADKAAELMTEIML